MAEDELYHYGVKGMKWGVRKDRSKSSGSSRKKRETYGWSKDAKRANSIKKKSVKQMTNKELQTLNKRMELEKNYSRLNPSKVRKGMAAAATIAGAMGTVAALYGNGKKVMKIGREVSEKILRR